MEVKVFTQMCPPPTEQEVVDIMDLKILDKTSLTSVVEFMHKFQEDASFSPPTKAVMYDSEKYDVNIDSEEEFPSQFNELDELDERPSSK